MKNDIDLTALTREIERKKNEIRETDNNFSGSFLANLIESYSKGIENDATTRIKKVDSNAEKVLNGKKVGKSIDEVRKEFNSSNNTNNNSNVRNNDLITEGKRLSNDDEQLLDYYRSRENNTQPKNGLNNTSIRSVINESEIVNLFNNLLSENYKLLIGDAVTNLMIEKYTEERIKNILFENKKLLKAVVLDVLYDIKNEKKNK